MNDDNIIAMKMEKSEPKPLRDIVIVIEPDPELRSLIRVTMERVLAEVEILEYATGEEGWNRMIAGGVTVAIASNSEDLPGMDLLHRVNLHRLSTRVIVISGPVPAQEVVAHLKAGAYDFLERPFSAESLVESVSRLLERVRTERIEIKEPPVSGTATVFIGSSAAMKSINDLINQVAPTSSTILVTGESGTGKEVAARVIHQRSKRADQPFVVVDCGTIPAGLVESELFGYTSGSFTGAVGDKKGLLEQANKGTVFLDEIGEFPLDLQVKLLRVLQDGEIRRIGSEKVSKLDLRVIAATNKELDREVRLGRFRQDLFYRLNVVNITMPPLRDRSDDIEQFVHYFLRKYQEEYSHSIRGITRGAMSMLKNYEWPGNVRELEHTILQIMALHNRKAIIEERDMPMFLERRGRERQRRFLEDALDLKLSLDDYAREFVRMFESEYSEKELAAALGITTKTLWQKRSKWGNPRRKKIG